MELNYLQYKFDGIIKIVNHGKKEVDKSAVQKELKEWCEKTIHLLHNSNKKSKYYRQFKYDVVTPEGNLLKVAGAYFSPIDIYKELQKLLPNYNINFSLLMNGIINITHKRQRNGL